MILSPPATIPQLGLVFQTAAVAAVAGHKIPGNDDSPRNVAETRQYIRDFVRLNDAAKTARELYDGMLELYPDRANPGSLWGSANAAKAET
jgi:hypothetical protein